MDMRTFQTETGFVLYLRVRHIISPSFSKVLMRAVAVMKRTALWLSTRYFEWDMKSAPATSSWMGDKHNFYELLRVGLLTSGKTLQVRQELQLSAHWCLDQNWVQLITTGLPREVRPSQMPRCQCNSYWSLTETLLGLQDTPRKAESPPTLLGLI